jgi:beta-aspartyl-peptidase (threonine type)
MSWALIIHGGAKEIAHEEEARNREGLAAAIEAGRRVLAAGGSALDGCEAAVRVLEERPVFNAGRGSDPTTEGTIEMCSAVMDGATLDIGGVMAVQGVCHPVSVARSLLPEREILLAGDGGRRFAEQTGAELCTSEQLLTPEQIKELEDAHDTVGAVAMDANGNIAAATSTGGLSGQKPGRVGDSPMPGCGYYADNHAGGVALSGHGEAIARLILAARIMHRIDDAGPEAAVRDALRQMERTGGDAGGIAIDRHGRVGWHHNSPHFAVAAISEGDNEAGIWLKKEIE